MPHPKQTRRIGKRLHHLEDSGLTRSDANALKRHLSRTEDKKVRTHKGKDGYEVWWAK